MGIDAKFITSAQTLEQCPKLDLPEFALVGRSNVGKSTFINTLSGNNKLAMTSSKPGKTRLINSSLLICRATDTALFQNSLKNNGR